MTLSISIALLSLMTVRVKRHRLLRRIYIHVTCMTLIFLMMTTTAAERPQPSMAQSSTAPTNSIHTNSIHTNAIQVIPSTTEKYTVLAQAKHNESSFTQGFSLKQGMFYESSGLYNKSYLHSYPKDGAGAETLMPLNRKIFAEGLEVVGDKLYLLTWRAGELMIFDKNTLQHEKNIHYQGEGWGLTHDGKYFYMSNGSDTISIPKLDFQPYRDIRIHDDQRFYDQINELEYAKGFLWANIWQSDLILKIHPFNGGVVARYNLSALTKINNKQPGHSVLNGIAYDEINDAMWITGKLWPNRYLVKFH